MKIYSGALSGKNKDSPPLFVTRNGFKRRILLQEPRKSVELSVANGVDRNVLLISYTLLLDYTGDTNIAETSYLPFSVRFQETLNKNTWFFLSNRIETFLREADRTKVDFDFQYESEA
ncbi:hypothetical protein EHQ12_16035 [Leptospira gomenensis]|uniref:Uncharacterized protein n=1 Tax=Leptospira gomenensis TaxID=2484974 RepID=A0A5F1YC27_9LEPT|nr:hypothetical protein [Leptospira gomenensis]TGK35106.1 hypothetical protein EHQ12_16035 [Leptospira gomenensis]TGK35217.1 hypothetical protein EHQ17_07190 [Leptospira gomenensis]TGK41078.1 hypothetical protein EHQ07_16950 [Leptospira gomenensis]TGK61308.1 hypothetical protein EHQ13_09630 [Leptospira gomenensis]